MRRMLLRPAAFAGMSLAALAIALAAWQVTSAEGSVELRIVPQFSNLYMGGPTPVLDVRTSGNETPVKAFRLHLTFPSDIISLNVTPGPWLGNSGRSTFCTTSRPAAGELVFACDSSGSEPGATGDGVLATLTTSASSTLALRSTTLNGVTALIQHKISGTSISGMDDGVLPINGLHGALVTVRALEGDINGDCIVNVVDTQIVASRYRSSFGELRYSIFVDLEPFDTDGDVDVKDLQFVFGRVGSTCEEPIPPQDPQTSPTPTSSPTSPATATFTPTATRTATSTATGTATNTATVANTETPTHTPTPTSTATGVPTSTSTPTRTATGSSTSTSTATRTPTRTATAAVSATATGPAGTTTAPAGTTTVASSTLTPGPTNTAVPTATATAGLGTPTAVGSTQTAAATNTPVPTATSTPTPTLTRTPTRTSTATAMPTALPGVCPLTQGFWKNHSELWPVTSLTLGGRTYTQAQLLEILRTSTVGDASIILAHQLIAAKLNVAAGASTSISTTIADADALLASVKALPANVPPSGSKGQQMVALAITLDDYNNNCQRDGDGDGYRDAEETKLGHDPNTYCGTMRADVDGDGLVSILDLTAVASEFLASVPPAPDRLRQDADTLISVLDLSIQASKFTRGIGECPR